MGAEAQSEPQGLVIRHIVSPSYVYLLPVGFMFFHDVHSGRVGLTYYHDEMRVVAERWLPGAQQPEYATESVRVQDATVLIPRDDYLRTVRTTLEGIADANPGLLERFGISLVEAGSEVQK